MKGEVMKRKSRLEGEKIRIEYDLTWKEMRDQEKVLWARGEREKGREYRIDLGRKMRMKRNG